MTTGKGGDNKNQELQTNQGFGRSIVISVGCFLFEKKAAERKHAKSKMRSQGYAELQDRLDDTLEGTVR
jgi:hypothetical protein